MSLDFVAYEDAAPTGTLRVLTDRARSRRMTFYGPMRRNWYVPPSPVVETPAPPPGYDNVSIIQEYVAWRYGLTAADLRGHVKRCKHVHARNTAMFFIKEFEGKSYSEIGRIFSGRHHSNASEACREVKEDCARCAGFALEIEKVRGVLRQILS